MAIAVTGTPVSAGTSSGNPRTLSVTVPAGTTLLLVGVHRGFTGDTGASTATFNGDSMTQLAHVINSVATRSVLEVFGLVNPDITTADVSVTLIIEDGTRCVLTAVCFSGTDTTNPYGTIIENEGDNSPSTTGTITSSTEGLCVDFFVVRDEAITNTAVDAGQTEVLDVAFGASHLGLWAGVSTEPGDTSVSMGWSWTAAGEGFEEWCEVGIPLIAGSTGTNMKLQIGDSWKSVEGAKINIGDSWKTIDGAKINIGDSWKTIF